MQLMQGLLRQKELKMEKNSIVKASIKNLDDIINIQRLSNENLVSFDNLKNDLENDNCLYFIYYKNNIPIAFIGTSFVIDTMDLLYVLVLPEYRKQHIATKLLKEIEDFCINNNISKILLEVRSKNSPAINFYEKHNFKKISIRKNYYKNDDALIYEKSIVE